MSIKAMTWAFGLPLEPRAKIVLLAIADNARDDGVAWPKRETVAEKTSQSRATVTRRIKALASLGVLAVFQRFREDGTQTTDEIRLDLSVTPEEVLRRLHDSDDGESGAEHDETDDDQGEGGGRQPDTPPVHSSNPTPAVVIRGGVQSCTPQDEPSLEQESTPNPLPGGSGSIERSNKEEPEHFGPFFEACQHWRTMDRQRAVDVFRLMSDEEQASARAASPLHAAECEKARRRSKDAHKLLGERFWERYPHAKLPEKPPEKIWISADQLLGLRVALRIADRPQPPLIDDPERGLGLWRTGSIPPDLDALGAFAAQDPDAWQLIDRDTREFAAWRTRIRGWLGVDVEPRKRWLEPYNASIHGVSAAHPDFRMRRCAFGLPVPCRWPPKKDGTLYDDNAPPAQETDHG